MRNQYPTSTGIIEAATTLVHPAAGFVFLLLIAHIDFKFLAHLGTLVILKLTLPMERKRAATKEKESEQHAAQVSEVADARAVAE